LGWGDPVNHTAQQVQIFPVHQPFHREVLAKVSAKGQLSRIACLELLCYFMVFFASDLIKVMEVLEKRERT
jgi:hypothetical protein